MASHTESAVSSNPPPIQFRLSDLMTAIVPLSLLLALIPHTHALGRAFRVLPDITQDWKWHAVAYAMLPLYLLPVMSLLWGLSNLWTRSISFPTKPGHWLLIQCGVAIIERLLALVFYPPYAEGYIDRYNAAPLILAAVFIPGCVSAGFAIPFQSDQNWRHLFIVSFVLRLLSVVPAAVCELFISLDGNMVFGIATLIGAFLAVAWIACFLIAVRPEPATYGLDRLHLAGIAYYLGDIASLIPLFLVMATWVES